MRSWKTVLPLVLGVVHFGCTSEPPGAKAPVTSPGAKAAHGDPGDEGLAGASACQDPPAGRARGRKVILFVWDGLRPDSIDPTATPNLHRLRTEGASFPAHHATYPTFTMMNASSFATGAYPGTTGYYGNMLWVPGAVGRDAAGASIDFRKPVFTEDYGVVEAIDRHLGGRLLRVGTLIQAAQAAGLSTAVVGKSGPAFLQDHKRGGVILDERMAWPEGFVAELREAGLSAPKLTGFAYPGGKPAALAADATNNGDPTAALPKQMMGDGVTPDPTKVSVSPFVAANAYLMKAYLEVILPKRRPDLSVVWLRNPDATQHIYGVGTAAAKDALRAQDALLGQMLDRLATLGLGGEVDLFVASDHGHSTVSGPTEVFPLRSIREGALGEPSAEGFAASGDVRLADLLTRAGFRAFDGVGCVLDPVLSGVQAGGQAVYPTKVDVDGSACGEPGTRYTTGRFTIPDKLPSGAVVIAQNGGSDYLYVPDRDVGLVRDVVAHLQSRAEIGAIFVDERRYGPIAGALSLEVVRAADPEGRNPDLIVGYAFDETAQVQDKRGIIYESMSVNRGAHGSFSPVDVAATLIAVGPDFKARFEDPLPTGNVDVAPTIAWLLGLPLPGADGRPIFEAISGGVAAGAYGVRKETVTSSTARDLLVELPTSPDGADVDPRVSTYRVELGTTTVSRCGRQSTYFDVARAVRE